MGKFDCLVCKKTASTCASNKTGSIQCNVCDNWWHPPCVGVDAAQLNLIKQCVDMNMSSPWTCQVCSGVWAKITKEIKQVASKVNVNEGKIASLEVAEAAAKVSNEQLEERVKQLEDQLGKVDTNSGEAGEARVLEEIAARSSKDHNLVLHNCPETVDESADKESRVFSTNWTFA